MTLLEGDGDGGSLDEDDVSKQYLSFLHSSVSIPICYCWFCIQFTYVFVRIRNKLRKIMMKLILFYRLSIWYNIIQPYMIRNTYN